MAVARTVLENWAAKFAIYSNLHTDIGHLFVARLFVAVRTAVEVSGTHTAEYRPQTDGQAKRFNSRFVSRLRGDVSQE